MKAQLISNYNTKYAIEGYENIDIADRIVDNSLDEILCINYISYLNTKNLNDIINRIIGFLRKGGKVTFCDLDIILVCSKISDGVISSDYNQYFQYRNNYHTHGDILNLLESKQDIIIETVRINEITNEYEIICKREL